MIRCLLFALVLLVAQQITLFGDEVEVYNDCRIWSYAPENARPGNGKYGYLDTKKDKDWWKFALARSDKSAGSFKKFEGRE